MSGKVISSQASQEWLEGSETNANDPDRVMKRHERGTSRQCAKLGTVKSLSEFEQLIKPDGRIYRRHKCKRCRQAEATWRYNNNAKAKRKKQKSVYAWRKRNPEQVREINARRHVRYYAEKKEHFLARYIARREKKLRAIPPWANKHKIKRIYQLAAWASKFTDERLEVDHIIPLQGETITGLHVESNLQILTRSENRRKWNSFDEDIVRYPEETPGVEIKNSA